MERATVGQPVHIVIGWDAQSDAGGFEVGELLRAWPRRDALALAGYRQMVRQLLESRTPLAVEEPFIDQDASNSEGSCLGSPVPPGDGSEERIGVVVEEGEGVARGAAAVLKAQSAGELQAMLGFLEGREVGERLILLSHGVGQPRDEEMAMAQDALEQQVPCDIYALNLRVPAERHRRAAQFGVRIREYQVFHELLSEMLAAAGLSGPIRELAAMRELAPADCKTDDDLHARNGADGACTPQRRRRRRRRGG